MTKTDEPVVNEIPESDEAMSSQGISEDEPKRWYNTGLKIGSIELLPYNNNNVQVMILSVVFFLVVGQFSAIGSLGGNGLDEAHAYVASNANVILYCCFAIFGVFSGSIVNYVTPRYGLAFGTIGYAISTASYLNFTIRENIPFIYFAAAFLGLCAAILWSAQGCIIMSYPDEKTKGTMFGIFWATFQFGSFIGSIIPLAQSANTGKTQDAATTGTYIGFIVLMLTGTALSCFLLPTKYVRRSDGSHIITPTAPTPWKEIKGLYELLKSDPQIVLMFPMFFASNWFYTYQFNDYNLAKFTLRTRSLNGLLYWATQILTAMGWGKIMDMQYTSRKNRAKIYWVVVMVFTMVIWGGGYAFQKEYTREDPGKILDWSDGREYAGPVFLYLFYGLYDAMFQTYVYWILGAMTNSTRKAAIMAGFYKGIQSAGAAVVWRLDAVSTSYNGMFASSWALLAGGLVVMAPIAQYYIKDHTDVIDDVKYTEDVSAAVAETEVKQLHLE